MSSSCFCASLVRGMAAGVIGTAVISKSMAIDRKIRHQPGGEGPWRTAAAVLGIAPVDEESKARLSHMVHWGYGVSWRAVRGLIAGMGLKGGRATMVHFLAVWGAKLVISATLQGGPPPWKKEVREVGIDAFHHGAYAAAVGLAYELMK